MCSRPPPPDGHDLPAAAARVRPRPAVRGSRGRSGSRPPRVGPRSRPSAVASTLRDDARSTEPCVRQHGRRGCAPPARLQSPKLSGAPAPNRATRATIALSVGVGKSRPARLMKFAVEWPGGVSPPGSRRSRREPLDSPGSCHPTWDGARACQWANSAGSRRSTLASNCRARGQLRRSRLYFFVAHRTRYSSMRLSSVISFDR